jgi:HlyD family secretion protein
MAEDLSVMELHVKVDEADVGKVEEGQRATFTVDAYPDRNFPAVITQVRFASQTESGVVTYETLMSVDNKDLLLRPGMTATAEITVRHIEEAMLIPNAALRFIPPTEEGKKAPSRGLIGGLFPRPPMSRTVEPVTVKNGQGRVWTVKNNVLTPVPVKTGDTDGTMTEVLTGGISPGLPIVTDMITANK